MLTNHNGDSSELWEDPQTESKAKLRVFEAFSFHFRSAPNKTLPCVIHDDGHCLTDSKVEFHHLDESGGKNPLGWFFENLVPICANLNEEIQKARKPESREELVTNAVKPLGQGSLRSLYTRYQGRGQLLSAYASARIGAFLAASPRKRKDIEATLEFATNCLWTLRGIEPRYSVPLATDTLARSVLENAVPPSPSENHHVKAMMNLADAVGSFHREFGDLGPAREYYEAALELADLAHLDWPDHDLVTLARNIRIFVGGTSNITSSNHLVKLIKDKTGYPTTLHEQMHILQWDYRQHFDGTLAQRRQASERLLQEIDNLNKQYLDRTLVPYSSFTTLNWELKSGTIVSRWDHAELLCLAGDAFATLGEGDPNGPYARCARDRMRLAYCSQREGHFAVNGLARPKVFDTLIDPGRNDPSFDFRFREPTMLQRRCCRTVGGETFQFSDLSRRLMNKIRLWIGVDHRITRASIREIQVLLN